MRPFADVSWWKRHRFSLAFVVLLAGIFFAPALVTRQVFSIRDHADYFQPLRYYTSIHLKSFDLPWWNPYSQSGEPWLANPQTGVFYPPTWLFACLPFETAYMSYLALHMLLLGAGTYLLFARIVRREAALVGAVAVMFSGPVVSLLDVQNNYATFAWVPLVIWCALARVRPQLVAIVLVMAFLGGEPFFAAVAALLYVIVSFRVAPVREAIADVAIAGAGAFGLSAVQLLPFLEMLRGSDRAAGLTREEIFAESMPLSDWVRVALRPRFEWNQPWDPALSQHFIPVIYVGGLVVALALLSMILLFARSWRQRRDMPPAADGGEAFVWRPMANIAWLALLVASALVAAGNTIPIVGGIFTHLPLTLFRYPSRVLAFAALAIGGLAAAGWDRVRPNRRWLDLLIILIIAGDLLRAEKPLFVLQPFSAERTVYAPAIGRTAKIARIITRRLTNRSAYLAGYLNLYQRRFDAWTAAPVVRQAYVDLYEAAVARARLDLLNFMGIGFLFADSPVPGMAAIAGDGPVTVFANNGALPAATFWSTIRPHQTAEEALQAVIGGTKPAVLDVAPPPVPGIPRGRAFVIGASRVAVDSRHARVVIDAPVDGVVMIAQQDDPAWRVFVDGREGKKIVAGGVFRAVAVRKGHHEIVWEYRSRAFLSGLTMTLVTFAALVMSRFVKRSAAKKFSS